jgi:hypothetical protein
MEKKKSGLNIKITDDILRGVYSNSMVVTHTREEFVIDFINTFPPEGIVTARIITSPGHLKRIIRALMDNLSKYEKTYGEVKEAPDPTGKSSIQ